MKMRIAVIFICLAVAIAAAVLQSYIRNRDPQPLPTMQVVEDQAVSEPAPRSESSETPAVSIVPVPNESRTSEVLAAAVVETAEHIRPETAKTGTGRVSGVITLDGNALPGVSIEIQDENLRPLSSNLASQDDGTYEFAGIPPGEHRVTARYETRALARVAIVLPDQTTSVDFPYETGSAGLSGRVTVDGGPPASVDVYGWIYAEGGDEFFQAHENTDGTYSAPALASGAAKLRVRAAAQDGRIFTRDAAIELVSGQSLVQNFDFSDTGTVFGVVRGYDPAANKGIAVYPGRFELPGRDITQEAFLDLMRHLVGDIRINGEDGSYREDSLPPGEYTLVAYAAPGTEAAAFRDASYQMVFVTITANTELEVNFDLPPQQ